MSEFQRLVKIVQDLRGPDGCPWDKKQTLYSMRDDFLEEAYEFVHALDSKDIPNMREELGDILLHVVLHAQIASEENHFTLDELITEICDKLIRRHPHVFGDEHINESSAVLARWDEIKQKEKADKGITENKSAIAKAEKPAPTLVQADKLQAAAAKVGFDWQSPVEVIKKADEELEELKEACNSADRARIKEEAGDLMFVLVNLVRHYGISAEEAMMDANSKFIRRFHFIEDEFAKQGKTLESSSLEEMDAVWNIIRKQEKKA